MENSINEIKESLNIIKIEKWFAGKVLDEGLFESNKILSDKISRGIPSNIRGMLDINGKTWSVEEIISNIKDKGKMIIVDKNEKLLAILKKIDAVKSNSNTCMFNKCPFEIPVGKKIGIVNTIKIDLFDECSDKWIMANGEEVEVKDMDTIHISNCIKMMERNLKARNIDPNSYKIYGMLKSELDKRL